MKNFQGIYAHIYRLNTKIRLTILCLSGFELYSRWVPLFIEPPRTPFLQANLDHFLSELNNNKPVYIKQLKQRPVAFYRGPHLC